MERHDQEPTYLERLVEALFALCMARREKTALMEEEVARERRERGLEVLTPAQVAAMLNVTPADIRIRISHGSIKATRNGGRWQIPFSEVKRLQQRI